MARGKDYINSSYILSLLLTTKYRAEGFATEFPLKVRNGYSAY